jgi:hypothetical protein
MHFEGDFSGWHEVGAMGQSLKAISTGRPLQDVRDEAHRGPRSQLIRRWCRIGVAHCLVRLKATVLKSGIVQQFGDLH